ncbi:hypothetical protein CNX70_07880 [Janthinobacterium svalbardensis]|uniref:Apea-like HEPN domain-containing protein n=1 Tax=Janthinobacterium svalbardensis TaxID=368607 RepID=A0A290WT82_9BURK|nr:hypothetical protein [Janthinobacterium svalbardensis]ATD60119.1 hypothetical protein CNX70_07880 [Janthinobacterium svalbardensis]
MKAKILFPYDNYSGNILWNNAECVGKMEQINQSLMVIRSMGYWVSAFPEGDGVTFNAGSSKVLPNDDTIFRDFCTAFPWLDLKISSVKNSNLALAELVSNEVVKCIVMVPLECVKIEESFEIGKFRFVCRRQFDENPGDRLSDIEGEYLEFETDILYSDVLKINSSVSHNDSVIEKCLSLAEQAMDIIRFKFSSFAKPEFTPDPAGQKHDGFYDIEIIPMGKAHLKPVSLTGISRPISSRNNWLGPELERGQMAGESVLVNAFENTANELELAAKNAVRGCRQSFYSSGSESKFLNLIFVLDALTQPKSKWIGWKHRTYISALISHGNVGIFKKTLVRYSELYAEVRNKLVHNGKDFYELPYDPNRTSEDVYQYIKDVIELIEWGEYKTWQNLYDFAQEILSREDFVDAYTEIMRNAGVEEKNFPNWTVPA